MRDNVLQHYVEEFRSGRNLAENDVEVFFDCLIAETNEPLIGQVLTGWDAKGTTEDELFALASIMRVRMKRIKPESQCVIDVVGTGGSRAKTFNVSTAAAFVVAGAGVSVAKHGNRAATSSSGSADVLGLLGVNADVAPEMAEQCLNEHGICFMFAPRFHSLSQTLAKVRRGFGRPTIFNNLGPLCNPAGASHQVIGVWSQDLLEKTANVLRRLGTKGSWVVHGENGLDEIALHGETHTTAIRDGRLTSRRISAADFGLEINDTALPQNLSASESAALIRDILENKRRNENAEKLVLMNAAAAIFVAGKAADLPAAVLLAEESVRNDAAIAKLNILAAATNR